MSTTVANEPRRHRLTVEEYYRMGEVGILRPDERFELIEGAIIDMPPPGSLHAGTVDHLAHILQLAVGSEAIVRTRNPLRLDRYSEPQPDLALLHPRPDFYRRAHPEPPDVVLVAEIADTSLRYDREVKIPLYARHRISEVWLIDVRARRLVRFRNPHDGVYTRIDQPDLAAPVDIALRAVVRVTLDALLP